MWLLLPESQALHLHQVTCETPLTSLSAGTTKGNHALRVVFWKALMTSFCQGSFCFLFFPRICLPLLSSIPGTQDGSPSASLETVSF